jgi:hypothetical protein
MNKVCQETIDTSGLQKMIEDQFIFIRDKYRFKPEISQIMGLYPNKRVDYIFISSEPSTRGRNLQIPLNHILCKENWMFHYCIQEYLKPKSYYITDVFKHAMKCKEAKNCRKTLWDKNNQRIIEILKEELNLFANKGCFVVPIGKVVQDYFKRNNIIHLDNNEKMFVNHYCSFCYKQGEPDDIDEFAKIIQKLIKYKKTVIKKMHNLMKLFKVETINKEIEDKMSSFVNSWTEESLNKDIWIPRMIRYYEKELPEIYNGKKYMDLFKTIIGLGKEKS